MKSSKEELKKLFIDIVRSNLSLRAYYYASESYDSYFTLEAVLTDWMKEYVHSGSSGGSCWGSHATPFYNDSSEIVSDIYGDLEYVLHQNIASFQEVVSQRRRNTIRPEVEDPVSLLAQSIAMRMTDSYFDGRSENEYYGNGTDYHVGLFSLEDLYNKLKEIVSFDSEFSFEDLMADVQSELAEELHEYCSAQRTKEIKKYSDLISSINTRKSAEKKNLESSIAAFKRNIESAEKSLENIDKKYAKELKTLEAKYAELTANEKG